MDELPEVLRAHSHLGAAGWHLQPRPADAPRHAVGYYRHVPSGATAWLVSRGDKFLLQPVDRREAP